MHKHACVLTLAWHENYIWLESFIVWQFSTVIFLIGSRHKTQDSELYLFLPDSQVKALLLFMTQFIVLVILPLLVQTIISYFLLKGRKTWRPESHCKRICEIWKMSLCHESGTVLSIKSQKLWKKRSSQSNRINKGHLRRVYLNIYLWSQGLWFTPINPTLGKQRQKDQYDSRIAWPSWWIYRVETVSNFFLKKTFSWET